MATSKKSAASEALAVNPKAVAKAGITQTAPVANPVASPVVPKALTAKTPAAKKASASAKAAPKPAEVKPVAASKPAVKAPAKAPAKVPAKASAKAPAKKSTPAKPVVQGPAVDAAQRANYIEVAAYYIAQRRGFTPGDAQQDYLDAAAEIDQLIAAGHFSK
jgi:hypothetical protein